MKGKIFNAQEVQINKTKELDIDTLKEIERLMQIKREYEDDVNLSNEEQNYMIKNIDELLEKKPTVFNYSEIIYFLKAFLKREMAAASVVNNFIPKNNSIINATAQTIVFECNGYIIRNFDEEHFWLENHLGEGQQISKEKIEKGLEHIFNKNF